MNEVTSSLRHFSDIHLFQMEAVDLQQLLVVSLNKSSQSLTLSERALRVKLRLIQTPSEI